MKRRNVSALAVFLSVIPYVTAAKADPAYAQCIDETSTNFAWSECGANYLRRLDNALNEAWKRAIASLEGKGGAQLLRERREWIKFKDASCKFYANGEFGREGQVLHYYGCRGALIEARIADLKVLYELAHQ